MALGVKAFIAMESGDMAEAVRLALESGAVSRAGTEPWVECLSLECLAWDAMQKGDCDRAIQLTEQALGLLQDIGDLWAIGLHVRPALSASPRTARTGRDSLRGRHRAVSTLEDPSACRVLAILRRLRGQDQSSERRGCGERRMACSKASPHRSGLLQACRGRHLHRSCQESLGAGLRLRVAEGQSMSMAQAIRYARSARRQHRLPIRRKLLIGGRQHETPSRSPIVATISTAP
jgi:hypothetical protein